MSEKLPVFCAFVSNENHLTSDLIFFLTAESARQHAQNITWSIQGTIDVREFVANDPSEETRDQLASDVGVEYGLLFFSLVDIIATAPNFQIVSTILGEADDQDQM